ncbi:radical SAM protein [Fulvitalea axinellae]|uniref:Radical SAM protein n=1 Tax=Fulvitalea axinellae TaxID=1182444 RepID=A0AAU9CST3_9BACT|nr:radical SAM protein [Fulvitalea axinellae]
MYLSARLRNNLNFASKLTPKKILNAVRLYRSFFMSKRKGKALHAGMPAAVSLEPTTSCNLRCPECPSGLRSFSRPTGMLKPELFEQVLDELAPFLVHLFLYFQGEPYLNPSFFKMVKYAHGKNVYTATSTNAHYLDEKRAKLTVESGLDKLIVSVDGTTQNTYEGYRIGGSLDKVKDGISNLVRMRKKLKSHKPYIEMQFLVTGKNEHEIQDARLMAKSLGVDNLALKTAQIYDYENGSDLIPSNNKYSRYRKNPDGKWSIKNDWPNECLKMWTSCVITWDGQITPCCYDKDAKYGMGNTDGKKFSEIWNGKKYASFRQAILNSRKSIDICRNCTEGMKTL